MVTLRDYRDALNALVDAVPSPVFPALLGLCALEVGFVAALPLDAVEVASWYFGFGSVPLPHDAQAKVLFALVVGLMLVDTARLALLAPLRRVVYGEELEMQDVVLDTMSRMPAVFVFKQLIAGVATALALLCMVIGATVYVVPYLLVSFVMMPALWAIAARRHKFVSSFAQAARVTRDNVVLVFGVQTLMLGLGLLASEALKAMQASPLMGPMLGSFGSWSLLVIYQFANFAALGAMFIALDRAGEFDR